MFIQYILGKEKKQMNQLKYKLSNFMRGRYGQDTLSKFIMAMSFVFLIVSFFTLEKPFYMVAFLLIILCYHRMFSKDIEKRYKENQKFLNLRYKIVCKIDRLKRRLKERKTHCFFKCTQCKQVIRIPKGKGNICVTCPKCKHEFLTKT